MPIETEKLVRRRASSRNQGSNRKFAISLLLSGISLVALALWLHGRSFGEPPRASVVSAASGASSPASVLQAEPAPDETGLRKSPVVEDDLQVPLRTPSSVGNDPLDDPQSHESLPLVYRCEGQSGAISLQSQPCAPDQKTTRKLLAPPDRRPAIVYSSPPPSVANSQAITYYSTPAAPTVRDRQRQQCENAKRNRELALKQVGLNRTFDLLRRLDSQVYEACKGL